MEVEAAPAPLHWVRRAVKGSEALTGWSCCLSAQPSPWATQRLLSHRSYKKLIQKAPQRVLGYPSCRGLVCNSLLPAAP